MYTILVVDDVQTDRELIGMVVTRAGHRVAYAADGNEAIAKAKPSSAKGTYLKGATVSSTMGPGIKLDLAGYR